MSEKPLTFKGEMVKAILAGTKTMTRRVVKPQPELTPSGLWMWRGRLHGTIRHESCGETPVEEWLPACPYDADQWWVREAFAVSPPIGFCPGEREVRYRADDARCIVKVPPDLRGTCAWRPSIHMPRWASRITLTRKTIRVERLQDITWQDIRAEGIDCPLHDGDGGFCCSECESLREAWIRLWESINARRGYGWDVNPWVWVLEWPKWEAEGATATELEG